MDSLIDLAHVLRPLQFLPAAENQRLNDLRGQHQHTRTLTGFPLQYLQRISRFFSLIPRLSYPLDGFQIVIMHFLESEKQPVKFIVKTLMVYGQTGFAYIFAVVVDDNGSRLDFNFFDQVVSVSMGDDLDRTVLPEQQTAFFLSAI